MCATRLNVIGDVAVQLIGKTDFPVAKHVFTRKRHRELHADVIYVAFGKPRMRFQKIIGMFRA